MGKRVRIVGLACVVVLIAVCQSQAGPQASSAVPTAKGANVGSGGPAAAPANPNVVLFGPIGAGGNVHRGFFHWPDGQVTPALFGPHGELLAPRPGPWRPRATQAGATSVSEHVSVPSSGSRALVSSAGGPGEPAANGPVGAALAPEPEVQQPSAGATGMARTHGPMGVTRTERPNVVRWPDGHMGPARLGPYGELLVPSPRAPRPRAEATSVAVVSPPVVGPLNAAIPTTQRDALIALYNSTNGAGWTNSTNWLGAAGTECTWYGVTCDATGTTVTKLELPQNHLVGTLPPTTLGSLSGLLVLNLAYNYNGLTGSIPSDLGSLTNLQVLNLHYDYYLTGTIPDLSALTSLQVLDLGNNWNLTAGPIPAWLSNLTTLTTLNLNETARTGAIPDLSVLTNLQVLDLGWNNNLTAGPIPTWLQGMTNLFELDLIRCNVTGTIPTWLGSLPLDWLSLGGNQLTGSIPTELGSLANLWYLDLSYNQLTGAIPTLSNVGGYLYLDSNGFDAGPVPAWIQGGTTPRYGLGLAGTNRTGTIPTWLGSFTYLNYLYLDGNHFTGAVPAELGNLTNLWDLTLNSNQLGGPLPAQLANLTNLSGNQGLDLRWNALYSTDATLITFLNSKQNGADWQSTQTVAPTGLAVTGVTTTTVTLGWTPILYTADSGGYNVFYSTASGGPYTLFGTTATKSVSSMTVTGLTTGTPYYFVVQSQTNPNANNANTVVSEFTAQVSDTPRVLPLAITTTSPLPGGTVTVPYSVTFAATGGTLPYSWSVISGTLPAGLTLDAGSGVLSGTPTTAATSTFTVQVSDGASGVVSSAFSVTINPITERDALIALYNSTNGPSWHNSTNWLGAAGTECTWYGVTCDGSQHVIGLSLSNNWLYGSLPSALAGLTHLQTLDLSYNYNGLAGSIPSDLGSLTNLQVLNLHYDYNLTGTLPDLSALTTLQVLDLGYDWSLTAGPIPAWLSNLTTLTTLNLDETNFTGDIPDLHLSTGLQVLDLGWTNLTAGPIPAWLSSLTTLTTLNLRQAQRTGDIPDLHLSAGLQVLDLGYNGNLTAGPIPAWLSNLTTLTTLNLDNTNRNGDIPDLHLSAGLQVLDLGWNPNLNAGSIPGWVSNLTSLTLLSLSNTNRNGDIPDLSLLTNLQYLDLSSNPNLNAGAVPVGIQGMTKLYDLSLSNTNRTGAIPTWLGSLAQLNWLDLDNNQLTGSIPAELGSLANLWYLDLSYNQLTGAIPTELGSLANLWYLNLSYNQLTGAIPTLSNVRSYLYLNGNPFAAGPVPAWIQGGTTPRYGLGLGGTKRTGTIPTWLGALSNLNYLYLDNNQFTGAVPAELGQLTYLRLLTLNSNQLGGPLPAQLTNLTNLWGNQGLDLRWNALYSGDATLTTFLNSKQNGSDWQGTQTIAPTNVAAGSASATSITVGWTPILYTADSGGYNVFYSTTSGGPYTLFGTTATKSVSSMTVTGLTTGTPYYFVVQSQTNPNANNANTVVSEYSAEVSATPVAGPLLTVSLAGAGSGTVTSLPSGINCGGVCSASFATNSTVTLTATAAAGSVFAGWSGACTGTASCVLTMDAAKAATATFSTASSFLLTVATTGAGSGTVRSNPSGIACGTACVASFLSGSVVTLTASPFTGSTFAGWSGEGCSGTGTCQVTMTQARNVTAGFSCVDLVLSSQTVATTQVYDSCSTITAGPAFAVTAPGDLTLRASGGVYLTNGVSVGSGATFRAGNSLW